MTEPVGMEMFQAHCHEVFSITLASGEEYNLVLTSVIDHGRQHGSQFPRVFHLFFHHPRTDVHLPQKTYRLKHAVLGEIDVFMVPLGPQENGMCYQVIFA